MTKIDTKECPKCSGNMDKKASGRGQDSIWKCLDCGFMNKVVQGRLPLEFVE